MNIVDMNIVGIGSPVPTISSSPLIANPMTKKAISLEHTDTMSGKTKQRSDRAIVTRFESNGRPDTDDLKDLPYQR